MPPEAPAVRGVLLDAVGTLIELRESVGSTYEAVAAAHGVALPAWRLDDAFERVLRRAEPRSYPADQDRAAREAGERSWWRSIVRSTFLAADSTVRFPDFDAFFAALYDHFSRGTAWRLRPGSDQALAELRARGLAIALVSNFDHRLPNILEELGIRGFFDHVVLPIDCGAEKPAPEIFQAALEALDLPPAAVVHVGDDDEKDSAAARALGMHAVDAKSLPELSELPARIEATATLR